MYANNLDDAFSAFALGETEEWVKSDKYMDYPEYQDEEYTYIEGRTIGDITAQISVQGESYSQYISFMMDRYYDGIDLTGMSIWIHYELKDGSGSEDSPVNVEYNSNDIRFGWIIPEKATQQSGDIKIGVWVNGTAPNTKPYILKTKEKIYTIHQGLIPGSGITQPDQNWFENFVVQIDSKVSTAQGYANDAQASKTAASGSATAAAESAAASAKALEDNKAYVESQKDTFVGYNKRETDLKYANALIGSASGTERVSIEDAWEAPIPGLEIAGRSEQGADPSLDNPQEIVSTDVTAVTVTGAQLFDASKIPDRSSGGITVTNTSAGSIISGEGPITTKFDLRTILTHEETMGLLGNERTFTLSSDTVVYPYFFFNFYDKNGGVMNLQLSGTNQVTKTLPDVADIDTLYVQYGYFGNKDVSIVAGNQKVMLNTGPTALPWQPYQSGTATITLTEPLHGVGDYRDRIMCKDGEWGIERYISHYKLTSDIVSASSGGVTTTNNIIDNRYTVITCEAWKNTLKKELYENGKKTIGFCTIAPPGMINDWNTSKNGKENVYTINAAGAMYISIPISSLGITADATRAEVTAAVKQYVTDHDVYVMFILDSPTWEPLPAATQSALNALTTYTGTTHVTVTAGGPEPDVGLGYVQDTNVVIAELKKLIEGMQNVKS